MAVGAGLAGGSVAPGHFGATCCEAGAVSVYADGLAVVLRDAGACDWDGASGRTGDGGPVHIYSVAWGAHSGNLGCVRTDPALAVSGDGVIWGGGEVDGEQGGEVGEAVADQQHLADERLHFEKTLHARGIDLLAGGGDDQLFLAAGDEDVAFAIGVAEVAGVQEAVAQDFRCGDGVVEVTGKQTGTLDEDLVIVAERDLDTGERLADAARLGVVAGVERNHSAFGEAVALADGHADGFVNLREVFAEWGRSAGRHAQPASEAGAHFAEEDTVGQSQRHADASRHRLALTAVPRGGESQAERAVKALPDGGGALTQLGADSGVDPLP